MGAPSVRFADLANLSEARWRRRGGGFAAQAAALDWDALDLFGCDQIRPFARIDNAGLVWLLNGDRLVALTERSARIEAKSGATLTCYRKPGETGRVLAWEVQP